MRGAGATSRRPVLACPDRIREDDRLAKIAPTRLRRRTSRFTRIAVKLVEGGSPIGGSSVSMLRAPTLKSPTLPVNRLPPRIPAPEVLWRLTRPDGRVAQCVLTPGTCRSYVVW